MNMHDEVDAMDAASKAIHRILKDEDGRNVHLTLSNGIVLTVRSVPPLLINAVNESFKDPDVPMIYLPDKDREEENPNDPSYLEEMLKVQQKREIALMDLAMGVGTRCESVPDGYYRPEQDGWLSILKLAESATGQHIEVEDDEIKRYLCWLRFYALEDGGDVTLATTLSMTLAGLREQEVMDALNSFRGLQERRADIPDSPPERINGNRANRAARRHGATT